MSIKDSVKALSHAELAIIALIGAIIFLVFGSSTLYGLTAGLPFPCLSTSGPATGSLILHAAVFWLVAFVILEIIKASN